KLCPTNARIRQIPEIYRRAQKYINGGEQFGVGGITIPQEDDDMKVHYIFSNHGKQYWLNPRDWTIRPIEARHDVGASHRAEIKTIVEAVGDELRNWRDRPRAATKSDELRAVGNFSYVGPESLRPKGA